MRTVPDQTGQRFGRLLVLREIKVGYERRAVCQCDCGTQRTVKLESLRRGATHSCGCLHREYVGRRATKHGGYGTPEYVCWALLKQRCENPNNPNYGNYGGRGITICDRWSNFEAFIQDMGPRPSALHSIDRRNNDGNYTPDNCHWVTMKEQAANKRRRRDSRLITYDGRTMHLAAWARETGIRAIDIHRRLKLGWTIQRALTFPCRSCAR